MQKTALSRTPVVIVLAKGFASFLNDIIQPDETGVTGAIGAAAAVTLCAI